jgi:hypothetical protein
MQIQKLNSSQNFGIRPNFPHGPLQDPLIAAEHYLGSHAPIRSEKPMEETTAVKKGGGKLIEMAREIRKELEKLEKGK